MIERLNVLKSWKHNEIKRTVIERSMAVLLWNGKINYLCISDFSDKMGKTKKGMLVWNIFRWISGQRSSRKLIMPRSVAAGMEPIRWQKLFQVKRFIIENGQSNCGNQMLCPMLIIVQCLVSEWTYGTNPHLPEIEVLFFAQFPLHSRSDCR